MMYTAVLKQPDVWLAHMESIWPWESECVVVLEWLLAVLWRLCILLYFSYIFNVNITAYTCKKDLYGFCLSLPTLACIHFTLSPEWVHKVIHDTAVNSTKSGLCLSAIESHLQSLTLGMWRSQEKFAFIECEFHKTNPLNANANLIIR